MAGQGEYDPNNPNDFPFEPTPEFLTPPSTASATPDDRTGGAPGDAPGGLPGGPNYTDQNMIASAQAVNQSAGQPNPGDVAAANGFSITPGITTPGYDGSGYAPQSNQHKGGPSWSTRLDNMTPTPTTPTPTSLPGGQGGGDPFANYNPELGKTPQQTYGKGGDTSGGGQGAFNGDRVVRNQDGSIRGVKDASGYYSGDAWSGYDNIINNAQRGDPYAVEKVKFLAGQGDARAQTALGGIPQDSIGGVPGFMASQDFAKWNQAHAGEIKNDTTGNNPKGIGDLINGPTNPLPNGEVYKVQQAWVDTLQKNDYADATMDSYHNVVFTGKDGTTRIVEPGWKAAQELAAYTEKNNQPQANNNNNSNGGGGGYPPRGNGGGGYGGGSTGGTGGGGGNGRPPLSPEAAARMAALFPGADPAKAPAWALGAAYSPATQVDGNPPYNDATMPPNAPLPVPPSGVGFQSFPTSTPQTGEPTTYNYSAPPPSAAASVYGPPEPTGLPGGPSFRSGDMGVGDGSKPSPIGSPVNAPPNPQAPQGPPAWWDENGIPHWA